jgi:predicted DNA-binding WGR domain protein
VKSEERGLWQWFASTEKRAEQAEAVRLDLLAAARRVLRESNPVDRLADDKPPVTALSVALADRLRLRGYAVESDVGESEFRVDLALRRPGEADYAIGVLVDGDRFHRTPDPLEREILRPTLLRSFGWKVSRCLGKDWLASPDAALASIERALRGEPVKASEPPTAPSPAEASSPAVDNPSAPTKEAAPPDAGKTRLEHVGDDSRKFWEIEVSGSSHTVRFGRIGTQGQSKTKSFPDEPSARRDADRLVREKRAKGYVDQAGSG